jgi:hypothetical protein
VHDRRAVLGRSGRDDQIDRARRAVVATMGERDLKIP